MTKVKHDFHSEGKSKTMVTGIQPSIANIRKDSVKESFEEFENVEHRLEVVADIHGIEYINDSKATNVNSTWFALESMSKPVIWIAGGADKTTDYSSLCDLADEKVRAIIYIGQNPDKIYSKFLDKVSMIVTASSMEEAVSTAYYVASKGEAVLLSPACASFDNYENFEERGHVFKMNVRKL